MCSTRFTAWLVGLTLLLHGSGVLSAWHQITHHTGDAVQVSGCDHGCSGSSSRAPELPQDTPDPEPEHPDGECELCLGLSGLHLASIGVDVRVVAGAPLMEADARARSVFVASVIRGDAPARAPPALSSC